MSILNPGNINSIPALAGVIQGEAGSDPNEQFAVASTISNRLSGLFGNFGGSISSVVSPSAFNGFSNTPNANATALATAIFNGNNLSQFGNPGNVTFFSASNNSTNPGAANFVNPSMQGVANAGNTVSPGGNSFSTGTSAGPSLGGTVLPQLGATGSASGIPGINSSVSISDDQLTPNLLSAANQGVGADAPDLTDADFAGLTDADIVGPTSSAATTAGTSATSAATGAAGAGGTPINITDLPGADTAIKGAGSSVQSGLSGVATGVTGAANAVAGTAASVINSFESFTSNAFVVIALVVMGVIFVAFGLGMFGKRQGLPIPAV
jgi:hypothetical protein